MKTLATTFFAVAISALAFTSALAACPDKTMSVQADPHRRISKDGTHAPLEGSANSQAQKGAASTGTTSPSPDASAQPSKDGNTMPMNTDKNQATSDQDVTAQQKGDKTAAAKADEDSCL